MKIHFLLLAFLFVLSSPVHSARQATISSQYAIIYADLNLSSPIGKISKGQKIKVGTIARRNNSVVPIAISGKIAWIRISDILFDDEINLGRYDKFRPH